MKICFQWKKNVTKEERRDETKRKKTNKHQRCVGLQVAVISFIRFFGFFHFVSFYISVCFVSFRFASDTDRFSLWTIAVEIEKLKGTARGDTERKLYCIVYEYVWTHAKLYRIILYIFTATCYAYGSKILLHSVCYLTIRKFVLVFHMHTHTHIVAYCIAIDVSLSVELGLVRIRCIKQRRLVSIRK